MENRNHEEFANLLINASEADVEKIETAYKLLSYVPNPGLKAAHMDDRPIRSIFGGNRSGKTVWGVNEVGFWAFRMHPYLDWVNDLEPPTNIRICCTSFAQGIKGVILPTIREWWPRGAWDYKAEGNIIEIWETRGNTKVLMATVELMCFSGNMPALLPDGDWKSIKNLKVGDFVQTRFGPKKVNKVFKYENAPVYQIRLWGGHRIVCTANHKHLTKDGDFVRTDWLEIGDILQLSEVNREIDDAREKWELGWTAIMIGDGCLRTKTPFFTSVNKKVLDNLPPLPPTCHIQQRPSNSSNYFVSTSKNKGNPLKALLVKDGLWNKKSEEKFIPSWLFRQPKEQIKLFLDYLWITDGTHTDRQSRYYTTSEELAYGVKHLIEILGYSASINKRIQYGGYSKKEGTPYFTVLTSWSESRWENGRIRRIEPYGSEDVYCVEVNDVHELIIDNIITSNSYDQDLDKFGGQSKHLIWCDEEPPFGIWQENMMRLLDTDGYMLLTMTPIHGMSWVYEDVYLSDDTEHVGTYNAKTLDNPHITKKAIEKIRQLIHSEDEEAVRLYGEFIPTSHFIYPMWDPVIHVKSPFEIWNDTERPGRLPDDWMVVLGIDPHDRTPHGVVFCGINREGDVYVFDEISEHCLISELAQHIKKKLHGRLPAYSMIDSSANTESSIAGISMIQEFSRPGNDIHVLSTKKGRGSVLEGIQKVRDYLAYEKDNEGKLTKRPKLYVFKNCRRLIREFKLYVWEDWKGTNRQRKDPKESPLKKDDHLLDCYDNQTEILTENGWKLFRDLSSDETVATLNPDSWNLEYQIPTGYLERSHNGEMLLYEGMTTDFCVTLNHRFYSSRQYDYKVKKNGKFYLDTIDKFGIEFPVKKDAKWQGKSQEFYELDKYKVPMEEWLEFIGLYLSEGFTSFSHYQTLIAQSTNSKYFDDIEKILSKLPFKFRYDNSCKRFYCMNKVLYEYLIRFGLSQDKFIPKEFKALNSKLLERLLHGLMLGDGTIQADCLSCSNDKYDSVSKRLIDDVQELLLKVGKYGNVNHYLGRSFISPTNGKEYQGNDTFRINFSKRNGYTTVATKRNLKKINYEGYVYCVEVPNHIIYVRRNGKPMWCGNSLRYVLMTNPIYRPPALFRGARDGAYKNIPGTDVPRPTREQLHRGNRFTGC